MIIDTRCPHCGAVMPFDDSRESMFCPFCGSEVFNELSSIDKTSVYSNEPNLYISFNTTDLSVGMVTRIVSTGVKNTYINGQTLSFHLAQGSQTIVLKIGSRNYNRNIVIPPDHSPVRIYASYNGRAHITIDQPPVSGNAQGAVLNNQVQTIAPGNNNNFGTATPSNTTNSSASQGNSAKKGTVGGIIALVILAAMMKSCICNGCSGSTNYESNLKEDDVTIEETNNAVQTRNGYDSNTNIKMSLADYSFEVPSYWEEDPSQREDNDTAQKYVFKTETDESFVRMLCASIDDPDNEMYKWILENKETFIKTVAEAAGAQEITINYLEIVSLGDTTGILAMADLTMEKNDKVFDARYYIYIFASVDERKYIVFTHTVSDNAQYDYLDDFAKVLKSLTKISITSDVETTEITETTESTTTTTTTVTTTSETIETSKYETPTPIPTEKPKNERYAFCSEGMSYTIYHLIDIDEKKVYYMTSMDSIPMVGVITSGSLETGMTVEWDDGGGETWEETYSFYNGNPNKLVVRDYFGDDYYFNSCSLSTVEKRMKLD